MSSIESAFAVKVATIHAEAPANQAVTRRRSSLWAVSAVAVLTVAAGWWWTLVGYGGISGFRQRLSGMQVIIANPIIDAGKAEVGAERGIAFKVRNCSDRSLKLLGMRTDCTCVTIESVLPAEVPAGAWSDVAGRIFPTAAGRQKRSLELYTDDPTTPVVRCAVAIVGEAKLD